MPTGKSDVAVLFAWFRFFGGNFSLAIQKWAITIKKSASGKTCQNESHTAIFHDLSLGKV